MADVVILGAGLSGLYAAAALARSGRKVLVLEKSPHIGGTSFVFRRGPFTFPMGPLSFGWPDLVRGLFERIGIPFDWTWRRNHFQLLSPEWDIVYSRPLRELFKELEALFPKEAPGLKGFLAELSAVPDRIPGPGGEEASAALQPAAERLAVHISSARLRNFLGSQGTGPAEMSMGNLAAMWRVMSETGIHFPSCGIDGLALRLDRAIRASGGTVRTGAGAAEILVRRGRAAGIRTEAGEAVEAGWIISTADYKKTILEMLPESAVSAEHRKAVADVPYTGSELCVYLGVEAARVDFSRMRASHLFFRRIEKTGGSAGPDEFDDAEIEVCRWSDNRPDAAPPGKAVLVIRVPYPYAEASGWGTGFKSRRDGYGAWKAGLAASLVRTAEAALPGLSSAVEIMDAATPLTYRDWGGRSLGSIAGWTWGPDAAERLPGPLLVETPVPGLLAAGIYASTGLFWGGVPTALHTAAAAVERILGGF
jgi:phytoene dehydrogenase-like protein